MNAFDTLSLLCPSELLSFHRKHNDRFLHSERTDGKTGVVKASRILNPQDVRSHLGLGELTLRDNGCAVVTISAKSLHGDYADGITQDNIEHALRSALPTWVRFDARELIERSDVAKCDVTENVPTTVGVETTLSELAQWEHDSSRFFRVTHGRKRVGTVEWRTFLKTDNTRMIAYDKCKELSKGKGRLYGHLLNPERFVDKVRIELNLRKHKAVRDAFRLGKGVPRLTELLESKERVLADGYQRILPSNVRVASAMKRERKMSEARDRVFFQTLFDESGWEWRIAEHRLRAFYAEGSNPTRFIRKARTWYDRLEAERGTVTLGEVDRVRAWLASH